MAKVKKGSIAQDETFDEFLNEEGLLAQAEEMAIKELIAEQIQSAMKTQGITKTAMALKMHTSRRQLERLLLELIELAATQNVTIQISIRWSPEVPPNQRLVPQHPRLSHVELCAGQPEPIDLALTTHLFLPRGSATSVDFAQRIKTSSNSEFLKSPAQIPACEKRFLRGSGKQQIGKAE